MYMFCYFMCILGILCVYMFLHQVVVADSAPTEQVKYSLKLSELLVGVSPGNKGQSQNSCSKQEIVAHRVASILSVLCVFPSTIQCATFLSFSS